MFKGTGHARYDYFDELIQKNDQIKEILSEKKISWPSSYEAMYEQDFFENLTDDQAKSLLEGFQLQ